MTKSGPTKSKFLKPGYTFSWFKQQSLASKPSPVSYPAHRNLLTNNQLRENLFFFNVGPP